jgi:hypothetical protein
LEQRVTSLLRFLQIVGCGDRVRRVVTDVLRLGRDIDSPCLGEK